MIVWGSAGAVLNLGSRETKTCETCQKNRPFDTVLHYRYGGLYWVFNFIMKKQYMLLCSACGKGWELDQKQTESQLKSIPIPFMRRYGLAVFAGVIALIAFTR